MDFGKVLTRSWHLVTRYRALWIFGIVLGIVTFSWGWALLSDSDDGNPHRQGLAITPLDGETFYDALQRTLQQELRWAERDFRNGLRELEWAEQDLRNGLHELDAVFPGAVGTRFAFDFRTLAAVLAGGLVLALMVNKIARYVSEAALIRMVGEYEDTGERRGMWQGLRLGLSRTAWRLFAIDLVVDLPVILGFLLLFALALAPLAYGLSGSAAPSLLAGSLLTGGLFAAGLALAIVAGTLLSVLKRFFRQACALEDLGVLASIRRGWAVVRHRPADVVVMWLIMLGIGLGWALVIALSFLVLFPLLILTSALGSVAGAVFALATFALSSLVFDGVLSLLLAGMVALPIFVLVMLAPWWCAGGLMEVYKSSAWTLTYRELRTLAEAEPEQVRAVEAAPLGAARAA